MLPSPQLWTRYLWWAAASMFALIAAVGALNVFIDALGVFGAPRIRGVNAQKPYLDHHRELARWSAAQRICPDAAIFGNSRAEIGFDPEHPLFAARGLSAFNHSIPGERAHLAYRQINWLNAAGCKPKLILLGVEFFDFLGRTQPPSPIGFTPDRRPQVDQRFFAETVFSLNGLRDSLDTVLLQRSRHPAILTERGFNPLQNYEGEIERGGHYALFRQKAEESVRIWQGRSKRLHAAGGGVLEDEQAVDALLTQAGQGDSRVLLVIYPYHAQLRLLIERLGLGGLFAEWKKSIVVMAMHHAARGVKVEVWDFSGIAPETSEAIPAKGDRHTRLEYFWEAGHFKKSLGDKAIARMLGEPHSFGIKLDAANAGQWLAADRAAVQALLAAPSPLRAEVDDMVARVRVKP